MYSQKQPPDPNRLAHDSHTADTIAPSQAGVEGNANTPIDFLQPASGPEEMGWLDHYRILKVLGEGGMGIVFQAEDSKLKRRVALKVIRPHLAGSLDARQRFLREAQAMAALTHDHIVTVFQVGLAQGAQPDQEVPFLAMQYLEGQSLDQKLRLEGALSIGEVLQIAHQTADGLAEAHDKGMIHRDIKPANLWLESVVRRPHSRGEFNLDEMSGNVDPFRVKILDFGLARTSSSQLHLSSMGQVVGTPHFMAPEQARGDTIDARADLFSLGCVLYTAISGQMPFDGPSMMAILTKLAVSEPTPLETLAPGTPPLLASLVHRLLTKEPKGRPASAVEVLAEIAVIEASCSAEIRAMHTGNLSEMSLTTTAPKAHERTLPLSKPTIQEATPACKKPSRRNLIMGAGSALAAFGGWWAYPLLHRNAAPVVSGPTGAPIKVGILHSQTGTMRDSEVPVLEMTQLAIDEINQQGGLLGRPLEAVLRNGASDERVFAREAERLIAQDRVSVLFGCWTSASRKAVKEIVEERKNLLMYPVQYEGAEQSEQIVYLGATPNQQLLPAVDWSLDRKRGAKFFLVGSDYIYPHTANAILKHRIEERGGQVVGEEYVPLGSVTLGDLPKKISDAHPDFILNTINGSSNLAFFSALRQADVKPQQTPTISFSLDEQMLRGFDARLVAGDYAAWNYFSTIPGSRNERFVRAYQSRWGEFNAVTDPMEAAYLGVRFWSQAVTRAGTDDPRAVRLSIGGLSLDAPQGPGLRIDPGNHHTWKYFHLGQITPEAKFRIVLAQDAPIAPEPFPTYRTPLEWEQFQNRLYREWGNRWSRQ